MISTHVEMKKSYTLKSMCGQFTISPNVGSFSFGRNPSCSFPVPYKHETPKESLQCSGGRLISPNHCELSYYQDAVSKETVIRCHVTSKNGVLVNGECIHKGNFRDLKSGDIIKLPTKYDCEADDLAFRYTMDDIRQANLNHANMPVINVLCFNQKHKFLPL